MIPREHLRRLHFIDTLFSGLTGHDLYLAQQITAAIDASLESDPAAEATVDQAPAGSSGEDSAFTTAAARLLRRLCGGMEAHGFFHWDAVASPAAATPLFAREQVLEGLRSLAPYRESTLLVTNLRPALCPGSARWSVRREREYSESLAMIRDLAAARTRRSASLNLLFL